MLDKTRKSKAMPPTAFSKNTVVFLIGRFRSGTTALWQLFDRLPQYTAWYEPLHPNLPAAIKYIRPQASHRGVDDYWSSYRKLPAPLNKYWRRDFSTSRLYLEPDMPWPALKRYIDWLIECSPGTPVLQFNRMDLRIGWLKRQYPDARIIAIRRQPYPLWLSTRAHLSEQLQADESHPDAYELMQWSNVLAADFPFLAPRTGRHSYFRHYALWRLSTLMADAWADFHLRLETLGTAIDQLAAWLDWSPGDQSVATAALAPPESRTIDPPDQLQQLATQVDAILEKSGLLKYLGRQPLASIREKYPDYWQQVSVDSAAIDHELTQALYGREDEITRLLFLVREHENQS